MCNVDHDELHTIHLGTSQYLSGSIIWLLVYQLSAPLQAEDAVRIVYAKICEEYETLRIKTRLNALTLNMFVQDPKSPHKHWPKLKAKAAETKWLIPALAALWGKLHIPSDSYHARIMDVLQMQLCIQSIIDADPTADFLTAIESRSLRGYVDQYLQLYSWLAQSSDLQGLKLFSIVPKHHMYWHWAMKFLYIHPSRGTTWMDEDFVGLMKKLCVISTRGQTLIAMPKIFSEKIRWAASFQHHCG